MIREIESKELLIQHAEDLQMRVSALEKELAYARQAGTERQRAEESLYLLPHVDELTGLYNRGIFFTLALQQVQLATRCRRPMLLLYCQTYGAEQDEALKETAAILKKTFRQSDIVARIGEDEFAVLAVDAREVHGESLFGRLRAGMAAAETRGALTRRISLNVGLAHWDPEHPCSVHDLLDRAADKVRPL